MPQAEFVPDGQDPTSIEYPIPRPSCTGCLLILAAVIGIFALGGVVVSAVAAKPKPTSTATATATFTVTPTETHTPTATPTFTYTPLPGQTRAPTFTPTPLSTFTLTPTFTLTASPTRTPTHTGTPFTGQIWISARAIWPKKDANTQSGVPWRALADSGAICPVDWPLGSLVVLETGNRYLCADRAPTLAKCRDSICTIVVFSQKQIDQQPRQAVIIRSVQSTLPAVPTQRKK